MGGLVLDGSCDRGLPRASVVLISQDGRFDRGRFMPEGTGQGNTCGCGRKVAMGTGRPGLRRGLGVWPGALAGTGNGDPPRRHLHG